MGTSLLTLQDVAPLKSGDDTANLFWLRQSSQA
jgi:hypothetical protein